MTDSTQDHRDSSRSSDAGLDLQQFHQTFFEEAAENLQRMEQLLLALDPAAVDDETLNAIFRVAHSIKGGAATFGFTEVAELSHEMETLLDRLRRHELAPTPPMVDVLLRGGDALWGQLSFRQGQAPESPSTQVLVADLRQLARLSSAPSAVVATSALPSGHASAKAPAVAGQRELEVRIGPLEESGAANHLHELFEEIPGLGEMRPLDFGEAVDGMRRFSVTTNCTDSELLDLFSFHVDRKLVHLSVLGLGYGFHEGNPGAPSEAALKAATAATAVASTTVAPAAAAAPRSGAGGAGTSVDATTLRVSVDKVDQLINLVGELVITQAMLIQSSRALDPVAHQSLLSSISLVERNSRDLQ
nr:Hpt domain-containing protein [Sphaerotilus sp.]